ncbi:S-adenosylmethionine-dependentmethyltransferase [Psychromonas sp. CNPT3]|uniref:methyltransferase domain-containing protein n=1 Tax=Psychromonas sp. CNPT3 TaxID=314282 RepID=UPI00006E48AE|nr:methyltransferase domain-containing protein [Psychromonas sp. CNPT3]AGH80966.1 S-adenosylmethionine-dependentmethyltransferase [Psychromonas sp. CNPT3]
MIDHNFDGIAHKFLKNIYGTTKGKIRTAVVWQAILDCLALLPQRPLRILDAGGGCGFLAQKLAAMGHQVVLCDISKVLLDEAKKQMQGKDFAKNVHIIHCPIQQLSEHVDADFDLILNHAVLEWLECPKQTLQGLLTLLNVNGVMSLMFYNKDAQRFHNLLCANFDFVERGMLRKKVVRLTPTHPLLEKDVQSWLKEVNFYVLQKTGVRIIHDYLKDPTQSVHKYAQLLAMEQKYNQQEPYASLGRYTHLMIKATQ